MPCCVSGSPISATNKVFNDAVRQQVEGNEKSPLTSQRLGEFFAF